jgi:hypothetical protein
MMVLLGYFLIAAAGVAASAIIGFVPAKLVIGRF